MVNSHLCAGKLMFWLKAIRRIVKVRHCYKGDRSLGKTTVGIDKGKDSYAEIRG